MNNRPNDRHGGIAPFGYKWVAGELILDSTEAPVRKLIFELFLKCRRKKTVARELNDRGHRTRNGSQFSDTTVARLLSDPIVLGVHGPDRDGVLVEPLVEKDVWEATQSLLGDRPAKQGQKLFTGRVYCECGGRMSISSGSSKYACGMCRRKIDERDLEEIFHAKLGDGSLFETRELLERWYELTAHDRRLLSEQILDRAVIGKDTITLALGYTSKKVHVSDDLEGAHEGTGSDVADAGEPLLSEAQAATFLGVSKMTVLRKRRTGEISFFRVGSRILYSKQKHLLPYLNKNENKEI